MTDTKAELVVGDLHGQYEIAEAALNSGYPVIFLGDYMDSFRRSNEDQLKTVELVLEAVENKSAKALMGNHEMSYMHEIYRCSGWSSTKEYMLLALRSRMTAAFQDYIFSNGFLMTHAGVSQTFLDHMAMDMASYLNWFDHDQVGMRRGGRLPAGGLRWCDWNEFEPVPGYDQLFGHSRSPMGPRNKDNNWCIDCLEDGFHSVAIINDGLLELVDYRELKYS